MCWRIAILFAIPFSAQILAHHNQDVFCRRRSTCASGTRRRWRISREPRRNVTHGSRRSTRSSAARLTSTNSSTCIRRTHTPQHQQSAMSSVCLIPFERIEATRPPFHWRRTVLSYKCQFESGLKSYCPGQLMGWFPLSVKITQINGKLLFNQHTHLRGGSSKNDPAISSTFSAYLDQLCCRIAVRWLDGVIARHCSRPARLDNSSGTMLDGAHEAQELDLDTALDILDEVNRPVDKLYAKEFFEVFYFEHFINHCNDNELVYPTQPLCWIWWIILWETLCCQIRGFSSDLDLRCRPSKVTHQVVNSQNTTCLCLQTLSTSKSSSGEPTLDKEHFRGFFDLVSKRPDINQIYDRSTNSIVCWAHSHLSLLSWIFGWIRLCGPKLDANIFSISFLLLSAFQEILVLFCRLLYKKKGEVSLTAERLQSFFINEQQVGTLT